MGEKEDDKSWLSRKDFEKRGIKIDPNWTSLQALLVVASLASLKLKKEHLKKKKKQPPVQRNGFLKFDKGKNKSVSGICVADNEKRTRVLKEKALKKPMKEENGNARVLHGKCRKLLGDAMKSWRVSNGEEHVNYQQKKKKKKLNGGFNLTDIPESLKEYIEKVQNGTDIMPVIQKSLYFSDVSDYHSRLSIPVNQVEQEFLNQEEKEIVEKGGKLEVLLIDTSLEVCEIVLAKWNSSYVLITEWNNVKVRNELKEGDEVQVWSFRTPEKLCLALVILRRS